MNFIHYLLQVNLYLVLFYGFYRFWLRNETFHTLNRAYLVISATLAFFIPVLHSEWLRAWFITQEVSHTIYGVYNPNAIIISSLRPETSFTWGQFFAVMYVLGVVFLLGRLAFKIAHLERFLRQKKSKTTDKEAFAFFNMMRVSSQIDSRETIVAHERTHIKQLHSADVLLFELITIFNWFNPVVYAYQESVRNIHEFLADDAAARFHGDTAQYAMLLFSQRFDVQPHTLTHPFFDNSTLKRRIQMLAKAKSENSALLKYGLTLPLFGLMLLLSSAAVSESKTISRIGEVVNSEKPVFRDGLLDLSKALVMSDPLWHDTHDNITVQGKVLDDEGNPLPGATVIVVGSNKGSSTDKNGYFIIPEVDARKSLAVSFVGFESVTVATISEKVLNIRLKKTVNNLAGVVVVSQPQEGEPNVQEGEVFTVVEEQPEFVGGMKAMFEYLAKHIKYPAAARRANVQGMVFMEFVVSSEGEVYATKVLKGIGFGCNDEATRVVNAMPKWKPGKQQGKPVNVKYTLPIKFDLGNQKPQEAVNVPTQTPRKETIDGKEVFTVVEQQPEYYGGMNAMFRFIAKNVKYPAAARRANVQGKVFLEFVVGDEGEVYDIKVLKGIGFGCNDEAIRVVNAMPKWKPGRQNGRAVSVKYALPIEFVLEPTAKKPAGIEDGGTPPPPPPPPRPAPVRAKAKEGNIPPPPPPSEEIFNDERVLKIIDGKRSQSIKGIDPNDITAIEVLKEKSATAIYGEEGKNGVLVITTRKGKASSKAEDDFLRILKIIDEKEFYGNINDINPNDIEKMEVLKDKEATNQYDEKGKYGVIKITLKKK